MEKREPKKKSAKAGFLGARLDSDVEKILKLAEQATGSSRSELAIESLMKYLPQVVDEIAGKRAASAEELRVALQRRVAVQKEKSKANKSEN